MKFKAVPGLEGDIWLAGESGLYRSTDSGASFTKLPGISSVVSVGFGKAAPGRTYPALYAVATIGGVTGVFRSDDTGASWTRINDHQHQYGNMGNAITGDPRVYGRVYLGTNGRGIIYGDTTVPPPSPTPTKSGSATASPTVSPTVSPTTSPTGGESCRVRYVVRSQWSTGFTADVTITNVGAPVSGWTLAFTFRGGQRVTSGWSATWSQTGRDVTARNLSWNGGLATGGSTTIGFNGSYSGANPEPASFTLNGATCAVT